MEKDLQEYYESLLELFSTPGWRFFIEDLEAQAPSLEQIRSIESEKDLWLRKGQIDVLDRVLSYEETIKNSYEELTHE